MKPYTKLILSEEATHKKKKPYLLSIFKFLANYLPL